MAEVGRSGRGNRSRAAGRDAPTGGVWRPYPPAREAGAPRDPGTGRQGGLCARRRDQGQVPSACAGRCGRRTPPGGSAAWARLHAEELTGHASGPDRCRHRLWAESDDGPFQPGRPCPPGNRRRQRGRTEAKTGRLPPSSFCNAAAAPVLQQQGIFYRQVGRGPAADRLSLCRARVAVLRACCGNWSPTCRPPRPPCAAATPSWFAKAIPRLPKSPGKKAAVGTDVFLTQASMLLADAIVLAALADRGIRPDVVAGHSYGEYVALMAAGAGSSRRPCGPPAARCDAIEASPSARGTMLAIQAALPAGRGAYRQDPPAGLRGQSQCAGPGRGGRIARGAGRVGRAGRTRQSYQTRLLPVPCPFHTPLMHEAAERLERALRRHRNPRPADAHVQRGHEPLACRSRPRFAQPRGPHDAPGPLCRSDPQTRGRRRRPCWSRSVRNRR